MADPLKNWIGIERLDHSFPKISCLEVPFLPLGYGHERSLIRLVFGSKLTTWGDFCSSKKNKVERYEILFREVIPIPNIKSGAIKIKVPVLVCRPDESVARFALSRSIMIPFLFCFRSLPVRYVVSSDVSIFPIETSWAFVSNPITKCLHKQEVSVPAWRIPAILYNS